VKREQAEAVCLLDEQHATGLTVGQEAEQFGALGAMLGSTRRMQSPFAHGDKLNILCRK
jgi:hypothetical protein